MILFSIFKNATQLRSKVLKICPITCYQLTFLRELLWIILGRGVKKSTSAFLIRSCWAENTLLLSILEHNEHF